MSETNLNKRPGGCLVWLGVLLLFAIFCALTRFVFWVDRKPQTKNAFLNEIIHQVGGWFDSSRVKGEFPKSEEEVIKERVEKLKKYKITNTNDDDYGIMDAQKKIVKIPVQKAMELTVDRLKAKPVRVADPIVIASPAPATTDAKAKSEPAK